MSDPAQSHHPTVPQLAAFALNKAAGAERGAIRDHVASCPACRKVLATLPAAGESVSGEDTMPPVGKAALLPPQDATVDYRGNGDVPPDLANHPRYEVLKLLGQGGMGAVYQARHKVMNRLVALKVVSAQLVGSSKAIERFHREVQAVAKLHHANIVAAHDADHAGGTHFLVMEYVEGTDLAKYVHKKGPLPAAHACHYIRQAALGLQHAHEQGMVHRDIKPHNLMLTADGVVKVMDFGLARLAQEAASDGAVTGGLTGENVLMGTADYIAPEQAQDAHHADIRADIYSLGCTLYHLLAGHPLFASGTALQKVMAHSLEAPPLAELPPATPEDLRKVLAKMLRKDPAQRFRTPSEVAQALAPFVKKPTGVKPSPAPPAKKEKDRPASARSQRTLSDEPAPPAQRIRKRQRARGWLVPAGIGASLFVVVMLVVSGVYLASRGRQRPVEPTPPSGPPAPPLSLVQASERDLGPLLAKMKDPAASRELLREELLEFCLKYRGLPAAEQAVALLPRLPPLVNSIGMKLAPIPPGTFLMGSPEEEPGRDADREGPQHEVTLTRPFYLGVHEVTVGQFKAFVKATGYRTETETGDGASRKMPDGKFVKDPNCNWLNPSFEQTDEHPVVCVSWNDAQAFCRWLSDKEGKKYVLPTEAQWEYSCRAGTRTKFGFGNNDGELADHAWYGGNSGQKTHPVGQKKPNAWGLYDMHGNAGEWCQDCFDKVYYAVSPGEDPAGPSAGGSRVRRGGSWSDIVPYCRSAHRYGNAPSTRFSHRGFRVLLVR